MNRIQAESTDSSDSGYLFGVFRLEADGRLYRGETPIALSPLELKALQVLLAHAGRVVSPAQMRQALWGDQRVASASLADCISSLRVHLDPHASVETVYKRGFRLTAEQRPRGAGHVPAPPRLAILPLSADLGVPEYLGLAIAEETGAQLSRARHAVASIVAQDSVFTLARRGLSPQEIGSMLQADLVLTGTLRARPSHFRLEVRMIRVSDGKHLWMEDLLIKRDRLAGLERELADRVTFRLQEGGLSIFAEVSPAEADNDPVRLEAWEIYQQAHQEWRTVERHHMQDAGRRLSRAIELDPLLLAARVDLANLCVAQAILGFMQPTNAAGMVKHATATNHVFALTPEAMLPALGWVNFHVDRDLRAAVRAFSLSAHLPHDPGVTLARSMFALSRHRMDEAIDILRSAIRLDPWSPWLNGRLIWALHLAGQAAESVAQAEETMARFPEHMLAGIYGSIVLASNGVLACNGDSARAVQISREIAQKSPYSDLATAVYAYALACAGEETEARHHLERLQWLSQERYVLQSFTAAVSVVLGEHDAALEQLRAAERVRCPWFFQMLADPRLKPLHGRDEFKAMQGILHRMEDAARAEAE
jgi:TolB-like protein/tetratricopeptide (TPR) repeat protein